jgi:hypothetical protein
MNNVDEIYKAYNETYRFIFRSRMNPNEDKDHWDEIQDNNDMAYFLLIFAQFDGFIVEYLKNFLSPEEFEDIGFMKKVKNLVDKSDYKEIEKLYIVRCDIAHGRKSEVKPIDVAHVCERLKQIAGNISSSPYYMSQD